MARFTLPRDIYHGEGSLEVLKTLKGKKAFVVVGGGSMKRFSFLQKVEDYLKEAGILPCSAKFIKKFLKVSNIFSPTLPFFFTL